MNPTDKARSSQIAWDMGTPNGDKTALTIRDKNGDLHIFDGAVAETILELIASRAQAADGEHTYMANPNYEELERLQGKLLEILKQVHGVLKALERLVHASEKRENLKAQGIRHDDIEKECWDAMKEGQRALAAFNSPVSLESNT